MNGSAVRLMVVENDSWIAHLLSRSLGFAGYDLVTVDSGAEAVRRGEQHQPDLVILEVRLPDVHGFELVRQLRRRGVTCPVLFLLDPEEQPNNLSGLTIGGNDYLVKPFSLDEVMTRIRMMLRRAGVAQPDGVDTGVLRFADLEFNEDSQEVRRAGRLMRLTPMERRLLRYLMRNAGKVVSRAEILEHVWPYEHDNRGGRVLDVHICTLRRKIGRTGPQLIHTLYGVGYSLRMPESDIDDGARLGA